MPGLTVTEKEHWKDRIGRRIDKKIETLAAAEPNLFDRITREARQYALESLGLAGQQTELEEVERQQKALTAREEEIEKAMLAQVRGVPVANLGHHLSSRYNNEVESAIGRRQLVHEDELMAQSELGRQIIELRQERENLLDYVWLACSTKQLRELWSKVGALLGEEQTALERDVLAIEPVAAET